MPTKDQLEIAAWNPLILDDKKILISTKDEEQLKVQELFKRARKNFPKHDLTFRYGWPHKEPEDHLCGMIGTALEEAFLDELLPFLSLDDTPRNANYAEGQRDTAEDYHKAEEEAKRKPSKTLPLVMERISDGELFTLNDDGVTYSIEATKKQFPNNQYAQFSLASLVNGGGFRITS